MAQGTESEPDSEPEYCPLCGLFYPGSSGFFRTQAKNQRVDLLPVSKEAGTHEGSRRKSHLTHHHIPFPLLPASYLRIVFVPIMRILWLARLDIFSFAVSMVLPHVRMLRSPCHLKHLHQHRPRLPTYLRHLIRTLSYTTLRYYLIFHTYRGTHHPRIVPCSMTLVMVPLPYTQQYDRPAGGRCQEPLLIMLMLILVIWFR
jgi:hypothetical protein